MSIILAGLNDKQQEAVTAPLENALVLAGAGSGKTRVLVNRIAWLISHYQLHPASILAVTFTNKAANEMKLRLSALLKSSVNGLWVGTFHGLCHRLLRYHYKEANLPHNFQILDSDDQGRILKRIIKDLRLDEVQWPVKQAQSYINNKKEEGFRAGQIPLPSQYGPGRTWLKIYKIYEDFCQQSGLVDFSELLLRNVELLQHNESLQLHYQQRFQSILVDEFQDTNALQYTWIKLLAAKNTAVLAVGDDDQSIYGWRGAKIENIHQFTQHFADTNIIRLEQNYRSTATILAAANALITNNNTRMGKKLWTAASGGNKISVYCAYNDLEEARFVVESIIKEQKNNQQAKIAILYRSNAQSRLFEETLMRAGINYCIYGGLRFFDRAEIKDALAYLRLIINHHDDTAFERIINFPTRGIGDKTLEVIREYAKKNADIPGIIRSTSLWEAAHNILGLKLYSQQLDLQSGANQRNESLYMEYMTEHESGSNKVDNSNTKSLLTNRAATALTGFIQLINKISQQIESLSLEEKLDVVLKQSGLVVHFSQLKGEERESRLNNLQELVNAAKQFRCEQEASGIEHGSLLISFLAHTILATDDNKKQDGNNTLESGVHLMTLHASKGLEFPIVFLVGMEEGVFPARQATEDSRRLEEERRLCYVGITRAMEKLFLTYAEIRRQYGREEYHQASRFLRELPQELFQQLRGKILPKTNFLNTNNGISSSQNNFASKVNKNDSKFQIGDQVWHGQFGAGQILAIEGSGVHLRVQVKFDEQQIKWLVCAYAKLELMSSKIKG